MTERQAQLLRAEQDEAAIPEDGREFIVDVDMDNNSSDGANDGREWTDEGEAYLCALRDTAKTGCVVY